MGDREFDKTRVTDEIRVKGYATIRASGCELTIEPRPHYCDRGRFVVKVHPNNKTGTDGAPYLDSSDLFPRYYFDYDAMITEIKLWLKAKGQTCG